MSLIFWDEQKAAGDAAEAETFVKAGDPLVKGIHHDEAGRDYLAGFYDAAHGVRKEQLAKLLSAEMLGQCEASQQDWQPHSGAVYVRPLIGCVKPRTTPRFDSCCQVARSVGARVD